MNLLDHGQTGSTSTRRSCFPCDSRALALAKRPGEVKSGRPESGRDEMSPSQVESSRARSFASRRINGGYLRARLFEMRFRLIADGRACFKITRGTKKVTRIPAYTGAVYYLNYAKHAHSRRALVVPQMSNPRTRLRRIRAGYRPHLLHNE